jgi:hypothetical protein
MSALSLSFHPLFRPLLSLKLLQQTSCTLLIPQDTEQSLPRPPMRFMVSCYMLLHSVLAFCVSQTIEGYQPWRLGSKKVFLVSESVRHNRIGSINTVTYITGLKTAKSRFYSWWQQRLHCSAQCVDRTRQSSVGWIPSAVLRGKP